MKLKKVILIILLLITVPVLSISLPDEKDNGKMSGIWLNPDGKHLFCAYTEGNIGVFDITTGEMTGQLKGHDDKVTSLVFSPDGKIAASGGYDKEVFLWDIVNMKKLKSKGLDERINYISFSADGKMLVTCTRENARDGNLSLKVWNISDGTFKLVGSVSEYTKADIEDTVHFDYASVGRGYDKAFFSADGKTIIAFRGGHCHIFSIIPFGLVNEFNNFGGIDYAYNAADGSIIVANKYFNNQGTSIEILRYYKLSDGSQIKKKALPSKASAENVVISPDRKYIAVQFGRPSDPEYTVSVYSADSLKVKLTTTGGYYNFSADDKFFITSGKDNKSVVIQDIETKKVVTTIKDFN